MLTFLGLYLSCIITNVNYNLANRGQKSYVIPDWHVKFSVSDKLTVDAYWRIRDFSHRTGSIDLVNYFFPTDSLFYLKDIVASAEGNMYSTDGSDSMSEFESIYKIDSFKNSKGVEVFKMYVTIVNEVYQDTIVQWIKTTRHVEGPIYYIEVPHKYYKEFKSGCVYTITGDSIITSDIIDDFEIN